MDQNQPKVWVRRQWNDADRCAAYRLSDVDGWHFSSISGGVRVRANRAYLHAYVMCDQMIEGELGHSCSHGPAPHRIKVCIVQKGNEEAWPHVLRAAECDRIEAVIRQASYRRRRVSPRVDDVIDCIITQKFSRGGIGQKRVHQCLLVPIEDVEQAWLELVAPLDLTDLSAECAKSLFEDEMRALRQFADSALSPNGAPLPRSAAPT